MSISLADNNYTIGTKKTLEFTIDVEGLELHEDNYSLTVVVSMNKKDRLFQISGTTDATDGQKFTAIINTTDSIYFPKPGRYYLRVFSTDNDGTVEDQGELHLWATSGPSKA